MISIRGLDWREYLKEHPLRFMSSGIIIFLYCYCLYTSGHAYLSRTPLSEGWWLIAISTVKSFAFLLIGTSVWLFFLHRHLQRVILLVVIFAWSMAFLYAIEAGFAVSKIYASLVFLAGSVSLITLGALTFQLPFIAYLQKKKQKTLPNIWIQGYVFFSILAAFLLSVCSFASMLWLTQAFQRIVMSVFFVTYGVYFVMVLCFFIGYCVYAYRYYQRGTSQQIRWVSAGFVIGFSTFIGFTLLPKYFIHISVHGAITTTPAVFFVCAFAYFLARYHIHSFTDEARKAMNMVIKLFFAYFWICLMFILWEAFHIPYSAEFLLLLLVATIVGNISTFVCADWIVDRVLFYEVYRADVVLNEIKKEYEQSLSLDDVSSLLVRAITETLDYTELGLFTLHDASSSYVLTTKCCASSDDKSIKDLLDTLQIQLGIEKKYNTEILSTTSPHVSMICHIARPFYLQEIHQQRKEATSSLLIPLIFNTQLLAFLVLHYQDELYTSEDIYIASHVATQLAPYLHAVFATTRHHADVALLERLAKTSLVTPHAYPSVAEAAYVYTTIAAGATSSRAEIWLYDEDEQGLTFLSAMGPERFKRPSGPIPIGVSDRVWVAHFLSQGWQELHDIPCPLLLADVQYSVAWLPLLFAQRIGVFLLLYPNDHVFLQPEQEVLALFAQQCAATLHMVLTTHSLQKAYRQQQEASVQQDKLVTATIQDIQDHLLTLSTTVQQLADRQRIGSVSERIELLQHIMEQSRHFDALMDHFFCNLSDD